MMAGAPSRGLCLWAAGGEIPPADVSLATFLTQSIYWKLWKNVPVRFARRNPQRLGTNGRWRHGRSDLWLTFGSRASLLTGNPIRATTLGNAPLNCPWRGPCLQNGPRHRPPRGSGGPRLDQAEIGGQPEAVIAADETYGCGRTGRLPGARSRPVRCRWALPRMPSPMGRRVMTRARWRSGCH
jgi:hypothetical protein